MPSNETFITAAYALTWATLLVYLVYLVRRTRRARGEWRRMTAGADAEARS